MTLVADTGGLYALFDADDKHHEAVRSVVEEDPGPIIVPAVILGELDYLLREFLGIDAELSLLDNLISGAFTSTQVRLTTFLGSASSSRSIAISISAWPTRRSSPQPSDSASIGS